MFCSSDSWDSAIRRSPELCFPPLVIEAFYFMYNPFPLITRVRGRGILRTSLVANPTENRSRSGALRSVEPPQLVGPSQVVQQIPQVVRYQQHRREPFVPA